jgi:RimJ/RimL family protein N-acetyltransferase
MHVVETERLTLRRFTTEDAPFILELLNDPAFLRFVGDKGVRTLKDARQYLVDGPLASYEQLGFGLYLVALKTTHEPIGMCGLIKRDTLEDVDIGFAFLPEFRRRGYGFEAAAAVKDYALKVLGLKLLLAITNQDNAGSIRVLEKMGFKFDRLIRLAPDADELRLYRT